MNNGDTVDLHTIVLDDKPLTVVSVAPPDGTTGVAINAPIVLTFSNSLQSAAGISVLDGTNTIGKSDPSAPGGSASKGRAIASGTKVPLSGLNPYGAGKIDVKGKTVGVRLPSSEEGPGVVIQKVTVVNAGKTPDGTLVRAGDVTYWVNWGSPAGSQPHSTKWRNRHRVTMHAEADLVAI